MTPRATVFDRLLPHLPNCTIIEWLPPCEQESLVSYSRRLAETLPTGECFIGGVSFGGIVALEIARIIRPKTCFLISSVRNPGQLPPWFRIMRGIGPKTLAAAGRLASLGYIRRSPLAARA